MAGKQQDGKSMLMLHTLAKKSAVLMVIGKKDVQMETKIGLDGVLQIGIVEMELKVLVVSKQT